MAVLLCRLRGVPEDEAEEIRALLDEHNINWYETHEGRWGISMPAIWLSDKGQLEEAQHLLHDYALQRQQRTREAHLEALQRGEADTLWRRLLRHPLRSLVYLLAILFIVYLATVPFLILGS